MAKEKGLRELLVDGSIQLCKLQLADDWKFHPSKQLVDGLEVLCDHIEKLERRISELEKDK